MSMQQRKDEILAKKAKLEELRRTRALRETESARRQSGIPSLDQAGPSTPGRAENRKDLDELINSLVDRADSGPRSRTGSPATKGSRPSSLLGARFSDTSDTIPGTPTRTAPVYTSSSGTQTQTLSETEVATTFEVAPAQREAVITYDVGIQTSEPWMHSRRNRSVDNTSDSGTERSSSTSRTPRAQKRLSRRERDVEDELRQNLRREIEEELKSIKDPAAEDNSADGVVQPRFPARALTSDEMHAVTSSEEFLDFVDRSSKVIERALDQEYDVLADYAFDGQEGLGDESEDEDEGYASAKGRKGRKLKEVAQFYEDRWCKKRLISDINFSPKFHELMLTSYTKNTAAPQDPSGLVQVWNMHLHSRPEYTFFATSDVLTAKFSPFHPSLIIGGSYSGQVLLWDTRARNSLPVQKTPLTGASTGGHTHPVYSVDLVGTQNANNILSCSTDGVVCGWTVDMLTQPQEYLELSTPPPSKTEDLSPTCMGFPPSDPTSFLVGTEEGTMYPCHRYDRAGAKAGVDTRIRYKGHAAPVMSLNFHTARGPVDLSDMVLTSSLDWTVKLWKIRPPSSASTTTAASSAAYPALPGSAASNAQEIYPVMEFPREDVVYDARWSPQRPGVFALVDGAGSVEVWNLMVDTEVPIKKGSPAPNKKANGAYISKSLNKVAWDDDKGKKLAVGGASGVVTVFEVGNGLSGEAGVKSEEWAGMKRLMGKLERGGR